MKWLLLFSVAVIATCGLIYELVAGTLASYLLGDSTTQFSTIIGVYLFSMGIGSYLSRYAHKNLLHTFIVIEILVGLVGGFSSTLLFILFNYIQSFHLLLYSIVTITGVLVGLEIPLMMLILKNDFQFKDLISKVFSFDYAGALLASLAFPLLMVPHLGLVRTSFLFGMLNIAVAVILIFSSKSNFKAGITLKLISVLSLFVLIIGFVLSDKIMNISETANYNENIIYSTSSKYQRITLTSDRHGKKLYLNGNLQFYTKDEYRYHEALVHPSFLLNANAKNILVLGGGDGCAVREVLKHPDVETVTLIDLDEEMTSIFKTNPMLTEINKNSLNDNKVNVINADAFVWLKSNTTLYDIIIIDFPDPSNFSVGKLYTNTFYREIKKHCKESSIVVIQATSPFVATRSYWCVANTLASVGFKILPYHNFVPSFGDWGYLIASLKPEFTPDYSMLNKDLQFFDSTAFHSMQVFPKDNQYLETDINKLNNQCLVHYFEEEWAKVQ